MTDQISQVQLSPDRLIELSEVTHIISLKKTAIYKLMKLGEITPVKLGRKTVFLESEIQNWVAARIAEHCKSAGVI